MPESNAESQRAAGATRRGLPSIRSIAVALLLIAGGFFTVAANIGVWSQRAVFDEDGFADRVNSALEDEHVQDVIALRFTERVSEALEIDERVDSALARLEEVANESRIASARAPDGQSDEEIELDILARPLARGFDRLIYESTLYVLNEEAFVKLRTVALRSLHEQVSAVIHGDEHTVIQKHDGRLVIDFQPLFLAAAGRTIGEEGQELLESLELPEDAGSFVVGNESDYDELGRAVRFADRTFPVVLAIPVVLFSLAVLASRNKRRGLMAVGFAILISAILLTLSLPGAEGLFVNVIIDPTDESAARATMIVLIIDDLRAQSLILAGGALLLVAATWIMGGSEQAKDLRARAPRLGSGRNE